MSTRSAKDGTKYHCNRLPFEGVLTFVDRPSDSWPSGARGHLVHLRRAAAEEALPGLVGMGLNYRPGWDGHDSRLKVGVIERAELVGDELRVAGYIFARDFPEVAAGVRMRVGEEHALGMSYELADAHVADRRRSVWELSRVTFTGAAVLLASRAAYHGTSFQLVGQQRGMTMAAGAAGSIVGLRSTGDDEGGKEGGEEGGSKEGAIYPKGYKTAARAE